MIMFIVIFIVATSDYFHSNDNDELFEVQLCPSPSLWSPVFRRMFWGLRVDNLRQGLPFPRVAADLVDSLSHLHSQSGIKCQLQFSESFWFEKDHNM